MMHKVIIIGGGPIGLFLATQLEKNKVDYLLLEASDYLGGQITELYPKKEIVDIDAYDSIISSDYIKTLTDNISLENVRLNEMVMNVKEEKDGVTLKTKNGNEYKAEKIVVAIGLGFPKPRPLGVPNEEKYSNILYSLKDFTFLTNKKVAIFGGGDSALDWAKEISRISKDVSLIHRRDEFRGDADTIKGISHLKLYLSYVPLNLIEKDNKCLGVTIKKVTSDETIDLHVDYILVNFGNIPTIVDLGLPKEGFGFKVNENYQISDRVYVIGDVAIYENKKKRIQQGNNEALHVLKNLL